MYVSSRIELKEIPFAKLSVIPLSFNELGSLKEDVKSDVLKLHSLMIDKYNYVMDLVRPPEGEFSIDSLDATSSLNYQCVMWSFAYYDYDVNNQMSEEQALEKMKNGLHPGAIYLLHAVSETNAKVLGDFIDYARNEGYTISDYDLY